MTSGTGHSIQSLTGGIDASVRPASLVLAPGSNLAVAINGTTAGSQYTQLGVLGDINITGVNLALSGTETPAAGQTFIIVGNNGGHPIVGRFNGLADGATLPNFLGSGLDATISYFGGAGNDIVIYVGQATATRTVITASASTLTYGQTATFTATVTGGSSAPTGSVEFFDGISGADLGPGTLQSSGINASVWAYTTAAKQLQAGSVDPVRAVYTPTGTFFGSAGILAGGLTVNPIALTLTGVTTSDKVYDTTATTTLNTASAKLSGILAGDTVSLSGSSGTFPSQNVGKNLSVVASGLTLTGAQAGDYLLSLPALTANITPKSLTIRATLYDRAYDGTTNASAIPTVAGILPPDSVTGLAETFTSPNVGSSTLVVTNYTVNDGNGGQNYAVTTTSTTGIIKSVLNCLARRRSRQLQPVVW